MPNYRLYCLDGAGRISGAAELIVADSDDAALEDARSRGVSPCELWQGRRLIARIPATPPAT